MAAERGNRLHRWLDRYAGIPLAALSAGGRLLERPRRAAAPEAARRVGVICLGAIGDLLLLSGLLEGVRRQLPGAELELVVSSGNAGAAPLIPHADAVAAFGVRHVPAMLRHVRERRYDLLIDSTQWARLGAIVSNLSGAGLTVGFATAGQARALGYDRTATHRPDVHETENFLALGRALWPGLSGAAALRLPDAAPAFAPALVAALADGRRHAFLHMWPAGYKSRLKEWPAEHWARLSRELTAAGFSVWLTGSAADAPRNAAFLGGHMPGAPHVHSLAGRLSLPQLAWLLARADAVVSVNTGIMHLAALAGAPTVGLHGATNPKRWGPVGRRCVSLLPRAGRYAYLNLGFEYPPDAGPALQHLPVEDVLAALRTLDAL
ncbi:glycosyltransferase family 9 protein [Desulfovibrio sp.]|uniref:glycosyltransferase family 9 protein n=1 Tax=Desulfovibrio sp. TaxID=885 RepID=UPI0023C70760|nr:glycosyltransferase family 9 protein [Desulfovibrio sp.]MDE7240458.1 glycosyltransferase family 9 protein [Desulfovibrio sp.]